MDYASPTFLGFFLVAVFLFHASANAMWRTSIFAVCNLLFVVSFAHSVSALVPLTLFLVMGYAAIVLLQKHRSRLLFITSLVAIVGFYVYLKQYTVIEGILPKWGTPYVVVGLSYILFRLVHLIVDAYQGALQCRISALEAFNYCCFFLTFPSGPIARFEQVPRGRQLGELSIAAEEVYPAFSRIVNGYLKVVFLSALMQFYHGRCLEWMAQFHSTSLLWPAYACACCTYYLYLYTNFSGYMDIVIGLSRLFGFSLPENFDRPMRSANFLELWSRWHITLSQWFKSYLFNPIVKGLVRRWPSPRYTPYFGVIAYFCTFLLMGFWHGTTTVFLIYGLCLGFGVSTNKLYEIALLKRLGKASVRSLRANPVYTLFAGAFALAYFAVALTCLWTDFSRLSQLASELGIIGFIAALLVCTFLFSLFRLFLLLAEKAVPFLRDLITWWESSFLPSQFWLAARVFFITCVLFDRRLTVPEMVYKVF